MRRDDFNLRLGTRKQVHCAKTRPHKGVAGLQIAQCNGMAKMRRIHDRSDPATIIRGDRVFARIEVGVLGERESAQDRANFQLFDRRTTR